MWKFSFIQLQWMKSKQHFLACLRIVPQVLMVIILNFIKGVGACFKMTFMLWYSSFWNNEHLLQSLNKTNIIFIPKLGHHQCFKDFRPISLNNVSYKIISKVLCNRLKAPLSTLTTPYQSVILKGCLIFDNVILVADLIHQIHSSYKGSKKLAAIKLIIWSFIQEATLELMQLPLKWVNLIHQFVFIVQYYVQISGWIALHHICSEKWNPARRSLSPFLYIIASNVLSRLILKAESAPSLERHQNFYQSTCPMTHLLSANDFIKTLFKIH